MKTNSTEKFSASLVRTSPAQFAHTINLASDHKQWRFSFFYSKQKTINSFLILWVQCFHSIEDKKKNLDRNWVSWLLHQNTRIGVATDPPYKPGILESNVMKKIINIDAD